MEPQISQDQILKIQKELVESFGIQDLPQEKQADVIKRAGELIMKRLFLKVMETLSEEDKKELDNLLGRSPEPDQEKVSEFLKGKISNLDELMLKEVNDFKEEFKMA